MFGVKTILGPLMLDPGRRKPPVRESRHPPPVEAMPLAALAQVPPPVTNEEDMLDLTYGVSRTSRLGCQIVVTEALDGLVVRTPAYQGR